MRNATVCQSDGAVLATVVLADASSELTLSIDRVVAGKGQLLHHYFGQGLRSVLLKSGDFKFHGLFSTTWGDSERRWFVELRPSDGGSGLALRGPGVGDGQ